MDRLRMVKGKDFDVYGEMMLTVDGQEIEVERHHVERGLDVSRARLATTLCSMTWVRAEGRIEMDGVLYLVILDRDRLTTERVEG